VFTQRSFLLLDRPPCCLLTSLPRFFRLPQIAAPDSFWGFGRQLVCTIKLRGLLLQLAIWCFLVRRRLLFQPSRTRLDFSPQTTAQVFVRGVVAKKLFLFCYASFFFSRGPVLFPVAACDTKFLRVFKDGPKHKL